MAPSDGLHNIVRLLRRAVSYTAAAPAAVGGFIDLVARVSDVFVNLKGFIVWSDAETTFLSTNQLLTGYQCMHGRLYSGLIGVAFEFFMHKYRLFDLFCHFPGLPFSPSFSSPAFQRPPPKTYLFHKSFQP